VARRSWGGSSFDLEPSDFIIRSIRQIADAIARIARLRESGKHDQALQHAERLYEELGIPRDLIPVVDSTTLADMLGRGEKIRGAAMVLCEEGHIYKAKGDPLTAFQCYRRAHELYLEARARDPVQPDDDNAILELSRIVPVKDLDPRYRGIEPP
jgi:hypothetical protein